MSEPSVPSADEHLARELRVRERYFRIGCWVNGVIVLILLLVVMGLLWGFALLKQGPSPAKDEEAIRNVLDAQVKAWNSGNLDGFMAGYWRDEKLQFMSGDRITRGWNATRERYQKKYFTPDKDGKLAERGDLAFAELEVESMSPTAAVVRGRYILKLTNETATGRFTLVFRVIAGEWKIISDHTSAADKPVPEKKE